MGDKKDWDPGQHLPLTEDDWAFIGQLFLPVMIVLWVVNSITGVLDGVWRFLFG